MMQIKVVCAFVAITAQVLLRFSVAFENPSRGHALYFSGEAPIAGPADFIDVTEGGFAKIQRSLTVSMWWRSYAEDTRARYTIHWVNEVEPQFFQPFNGGEAFLFATSTEFRASLNSNPDLAGFDPSAWNHYAVTYEQVEIQGFNTSLFSFFMNGTRFHSHRTIQTEDFSQFEKSLFFLGPALQEGVDTQNVINVKSSPRGVMDDVALYSRALTPEEIASIYQNGTTVSSSDLVLFYDFEDCITNPGSCSVVTSKTDTTYSLSLGAIGNKTEFLESSGVPNRDKDECIVTKELDMPKLVPSARNFGASGTEALVFVNISNNMDISLAGFDVGSGAVEQQDGGQATMGINSQYTITYDNSNHMSFVVNSGALRVHAYRPRPPEGCETTLSVEVGQNENITIPLLDCARAPFGERLVAAITELPDPGKVLLFQVNRGEKDDPEDPSRGALINETTVVADLSGLVFATFIDSSSPGSGFPTFKYEITSEATGLANAVTVEIKSKANRLPVLNYTSKTLVEDSDLNEGFLEITISDDDSMNIMGVVRTLPEHGTLYKVYGDEPLTNNTVMISSSYEATLDDNIVEQFVANVKRVSSFWGTPPSLDYHALNVIGPPLCSLAGECIDERLLTKKRLSEIQRLELVKVRLDPESEESEVPAVVIKIYESVGFATAYEVRLLFLRDRFGVPCLMQNASGDLYEGAGELANVYPIGCRTVEVGAERRNVTIDNMFPLGAAAWSPRSQKLVLGSKIEGVSAEAYGTRFDFTLDHNSTYLNGDGYTEFIEVEFETEVYPEGVEIGSSRGSGAVIRVQAKDPLGDWHDLWSGSPRKSLSAENEENGLYSVFKVPICTHAYATKELRIELDTSAETESPIGTTSTISCYWALQSPNRQ